VTRSTRSRARPQLRALAERLGIIASYVDQTGRITRHTSDATREALLSVMGFDAPTEDAARGWLAELDHQELETILEPVRVVERDSAQLEAVRIRVPEGVGTAAVTVVMQEETGPTWTVRAQARRLTTIRLPTRAPLGYHTITAEVRAAGQTWTAEQLLIVVPARCMDPVQALESRRVAGIVANLYATRREHDWGVGDFTTLLLLVEWAAHRSAAFVGVNPLHALFNRGSDVSPYSPITRLFRNPIYIDVAQVPELEQSVSARQRVAELQSVISSVRGSDHVDYDRVSAVKNEVLTVLYQAFRDRRGGPTSAAATARLREYDAFVAAREPELTQFATWMAIAETSGIPDWRAWPAALHDPNSPTTRSYQATHAERIDFHRWCQFEASRQLGEASRRARTLGMPIGVYQDLAIGTNPGGSDTWSNTELFLTGASVGAPPDPYASFGQNWGLPPMAPHVLRAQRYRYWIQVLRRAFEHAGALRIDHILGLFRSFWIPEGATGREGAYVRMPTRELLGILALESARHGAIVVGEDLGTVPDDVPPTLRRWGILSSKVLYFERTNRGFKPASSYPALSLATANTHDLPSLTGFWSGRDVELRRDHGLLATKREVRLAFDERERERFMLWKLLRLPNSARDYAEHFNRVFTTAAHNFLCSTKAMLVGLSLDDIMGEREPVNLPGVGPDKYPSWRRRSRMTVEELGWSFEADAMLGCDDRRSRK
jgi:4-alpha-glucanotransferase